jgi:hypothetical protein
LTGLSGSNFQPACASCSLHRCYHLVVIDRLLVGYPDAHVPNRARHRETKKTNETGARFCSAIYFSSATHVLTASSTALDKSPFLPLNLSMVLNLSFFSSSSGSSTQIRPISITKFYFCARFARVRCFSNKQIP